MKFSDLEIINVSYPNEAIGWENGVYTPRAALITNSNATITASGIEFTTRMWTETEQTGFGVYPYVNSIAFKYHTGLNDGKWTVTLKNNSSCDQTITCFANGIVKMPNTNVPAASQVIVDFTICSIEEDTILQFYQVDTATDFDSSVTATINIIDISYEQLPAKNKGIKPTIFLASDSTVQTYEDFYQPQTGWGQTFVSFFGSDNIKEYMPDNATYPQCRAYETESIIIENRSIGARSSKTFIEEGKWDQLLHQAKPGDICLIQWAHNDATAVRPNRYVKSTDMHIYLDKYSKSCKARGITPIFVTPVSRRNCDDHNGEFVLSFGEYRDAIIDFAKSAGDDYIDLCTLSNELLKEAGSEGAKLLHLYAPADAFPEGAYANGVSDNTHLSHYGALKYGQIVANEFKKLTNPALANIVTLINTDITITKPVFKASSITVDPEVPQNLAMQELHVENKTADFLLSWADVKGAISYNVYRKGSVDFQFFPLRSVSAEEKTKNPVLPFKLPAADVYQVYVTAVFEKGKESSPSKRIEFRT